VRHAYVGNVHDKRTGSTYCHGCVQLLVGRDWYELSQWNLTEDGTCTRCHTPCAGVFDGPPGNWGARRQPVRLNDFAAA
jgi:pyruvate formate lyase activating enzyme